LAALIAVAACGSSASVRTTSAGPTQMAGVAVANPSTVPVSLGTPAPSAAPTATPSLPSNSELAAGLQELQSQMVAVIKKVTPSVVVIETPGGLGSGVIYDAAGDIITNAHVVGTSKTFQVTLSNGKIYSGSLVASYSPDDIAVIKVTAPNMVPAVFGDSSKLSVGDFVLAMGSPLGLQSSVTEGIVSALGRSVSEPRGNALPDTIQTSAAINPGNSGGALVDLQGDVIGIPTLAATDPQGGTSTGIGFAISSNRARLIADQLIASGKVSSSGRAYLGVTLTDTNGGAGIVTVVPGSPAAKAGIVAGDIVLSVNALITPDTSTLAEVLAKLAPGDVARVQVQHQNGTSSTFNVTLGQLPG
jgi:S1-C subfamily serine protease